MNRLPVLLRHLEAYVQEEIGAQGRTAALLDAQRSAVRTADPAAIAESTRAVETELGTSARRARRRDELLKGFARLWSVDPGSLTLASVIERAGPAADRLQRQRLELRKATSEVSRRARLVGTAAREHQRLTADIIRTVLAGVDTDAEGGGSQDSARGGVLVDAEA